MAAVVAFILQAISFYLFYRIGNWELFGAVFFYFWANNLGHHISMHKS